MDKMVTVVSYQTVRHMENGVADQKEGRKEGRERETVAILCWKWGTEQGDFFAGAR